MVMDKTRMQKLLREACSSELIVFNVFRKGKTNGF